MAAISFVVILPMSAASGKMLSVELDRYPFTRNQTLAAPSIGLFIGMLGFFLWFSVACLACLAWMGFQGIE
jgi:hypothetical protein